MTRMLTQRSLALLSVCVTAVALLAAVPDAAVQEPVNSSWLPPLGGSTVSRKLTVELPAKAGSHRIDVFTSFQSGDALGARGLWRYVSLGRPTGDETKLDGLFVFQSGRFVQQSLNIGEPLASQLAQAHAGTYTVENGRIKLLAEVGLIVNPKAPTPVASSPNRNHELAVARNGDRLVLTFGSGTVQKFTRVGPASGRIVPLSRGALALVDGHFILVFEDGPRAVAGSGTYTAEGATLRFAPGRWLSARDGKVSYSTVPREATLTATSLDIAGEAPIKFLAPTK